MILRASLALEHQSPISYSRHHRSASEVRGCVDVSDHVIINLYVITALFYWAPGNNCTELLTLKEGFSFFFLE